MRIEAVEVENGFLIPFVEELQNITHQTIVLDVTVINSGKDDSGENEIDHFFDQYHFDMSDIQFDREEANARKGKVLVCDTL